MAATAPTIAAPADLAAPARRGVLSDLSAFAAVAIAGLSAAAGGIHGAAFPEHAKEHWTFGVFFAGSAAFQIGWAFLAVRRLSPLLLRLGALANAGFVLVWFMTRTTGPPFGPTPWMPERIGFVDGVTVAIEVTLIVLAVRLSRPGALEGLKGRRTPAPLYVVSAAIGVVALVALAAARDHAREMRTGPGHSREVLIATATGLAIYCLTLLRRARSFRV